MDVNPEKEKRFREIDFLRGAAVIMMIFFHLLFDLNYFSVFEINVHSGFWRYFATATAFVFIFLAGVSLTLSYSKVKDSVTQNELFMKYLKRGLKIFSWGLIITIVTWIFLRDGFIAFGILHFIGLSIILAYPFIKYRYRNLMLGILFILTGWFIAKFSFDFYWLFWLGFEPHYFYTFDYFPLLPWFGVILIGIFFGNTFYTQYGRKFKIPKLSDFIFIRLFCFLGRHSLIIYLIHQPILIALLYFFGIKLNL